MEEIYALLMIATTIGVLLLGFPVSLSLAGSALFFATIGGLFGVFDFTFISAYPSRIYGIMSNETLISVSLFIFMGVILERSGIAEELLETMALLFGGMYGGLGVSVCLVGMLLAASTGIAGATVVIMGLISLPSMLRHKYQPSLATGIVVASGTLGQIIPPSIILIVLGDQMSSAYQQSLIEQGDYSGATVSIGDLFAGALFPGLLLVFFYIVYIIIYARIRPEVAPAIRRDALLAQLKSKTKPDKGSSKKLSKKISKKKKSKALKSKNLSNTTSFIQIAQAMGGGVPLLIHISKVLIPPLLLVFSVLGSILMGFATPTEAASVGCVGALFLALFKHKLKRSAFVSLMQSAMNINCMVFFILIGASMFSLVFRAYGGDDMVASFLQNLPGGKWSAFFLVMLLMFVLGFFLDFFEITFIVVPIVAPVLLNMGITPIWLGVVIALNLQTSFLTPPFGFSLFYLRGVAPASLPTIEIYKGVLPFILIQLFVILLLIFIPELATALPQVIFD